MINEVTVSENESRGDNHEVKVNEGGETFEQQLSEQSMPTLQKGMIIKGKVVQITSDVVLFDIGWKTEGYMPIGELVDEIGAALEVNGGDELEVAVDGRDGDGIFVLSRKQIIKNKLWEYIAKAQETGGLIQGVVNERVKGGFMVSLGGVSAFLPGSQAASELLNNFESSKGNSYYFEVVKYEKKRGNVVVSQKSALKKEEQRRREETMGLIKEGDIVTGVVKNIIDYGVFIDIGGVDGLLHMSDIAWGRMVKPSDCYQRGDNVTVKLLSFDKEKGKVYLGVKQLSPDPWDSIARDYKIGDIVEGKVTNVLNYGFFVELSSGIIGLVHRNEISWGKPIRNPQKAVNIGENVSVMVIGIDDVAKKISLSWRRTIENPWETIKQRYPVGKLVTGPVKNMTTFGVFIGLEEGVDGLLHISDMSWRKNISHPNDLFKKGDVITAMVLSVDADAEKISLGTKQLEADPWTSFEKNYPIGTPIIGKVTSIADFGVFISVEENIEGLMHVSEFNNGSQKQKGIPFSVGDEITVTVKDIDSKNKRIKFSMKSANEFAKEVATKAHHPLKEETVATTAIGEALANALQQKEEAAR